MIDVPARMQKLGLLAEAEQLRELAQPSVRLMAGPRSETHSDVRIGGSKIGGYPDLPPDTAWPRFGQRPLAFAAQIDLEDVAAVAATDLPDSGLLSFFFEGGEASFGVSSDADAIRIIHTPARTSLVRTPAPEALDFFWLFEERPLRPESETTWPDPGSVDTRRLGWDHETTMTYSAIVGGAFLSPPPMHRMLGWAQRVQVDPRLTCEMVASGIRSFGDPRVAECEERVGDWVLLLQIDSDEELEVIWGVIGRAYFLIRRDDLRARAFDRALVERQRQ
jgi:uncharacterized protein YwqG